MAISSPLSLSKIRQSTSSLNFVSKQNSRKTTAITKTLNSSIEKKKNLWSSIKLFKRKRIDFQNRISLRDKILSSSLLKKPGGARLLASSSKSTSITNRLLGFIGYASAGWILSNLPTWIALGEQFSSRLITAGSILSNYGDEAISVMAGIGNVFNSAFQNLARFDFSDSSFLVRSSLNDLRVELDNLGNGFEEALSVLLQPFKDIPEIGTIQPDEKPETTPPPSAPSGGGFSGSGVSKGTQIAKRLQKDLGLKDYQAAAVVGNLLNESSQLNPAQIQNGGSGLLKVDGKTGYGWAQWTDSGRQRKLYVLAQKMGIDPSKQPLTDEVNYAMLVSELPTYDSGGRFRSSRNLQEASNWLLTQYFKPADQGSGEQKERIRDSQQVLKSLKSTSSIPPVERTGPKPPPITGQRKLQSGDIFTKSLGKGVDIIRIGDIYGAPRGNRKHGGIDIQVPQGT